MNIVDDSLEHVNRLIEQLDLDGAEKELQRLTASFPESVAVLRAWGILEHLRGNHQRAIGYLDEAIKGNPNDSIAFVCAGQAYRAMGALPLAEVNLRRALHIEPGRHDAHLNLGLTLWSMGEHARAGVYFRNVGSLGRKSAQAEFYLGLLELETGNRESAARHFDSCLEIDPEFSEARARKAQMQFDAGWTVEAAGEMAQIANLPSVTAQHLMAAAKYGFEIAHEPAALLHVERALSLMREYGEKEQVEPYRGRLSDIVSWASRRDYAVTRVAKEQMHKLRSPTMKGASLDASAYPMPLTPDIFVIVVPDCDVYQDGYVPVAADGSTFFFRILSDGIRQPYSNSNVLHVCDDGRLLLRRPIEVTYFDEPVLYLGDERDYFGWLFQNVSRLWAYAQMPGMQDLPLLVRAEEGSWRDQMLAVLGAPPARRIASPMGGRLFCRQLNIATQINPHNMIAPFALEYLRRQVRAKVQLGADHPKRIFVTREMAGFRRLANWPALAPIFERAGFVTLEAGSMSLVELLSIFMSAEVIVGIEGDAMANTFAAPAQCRIGLIVARETNAERYATPSMTLGQDFAFLAAEVDYTSSDTLEMCDLILDPGILSAYLATTS